MGGEGGFVSLSFSWYSLRCDGIATGGLGLMLESTGVRRGVMGAPRTERGAMEDIRLNMMSMDRRNDEYRGKAGELQSWYGVVFIRSNIRR